MSNCPNGHWLLKDAFAVKRIADKWQVHEFNAVKTKKKIIITKH